MWHHPAGYPHQLFVFRLRQNYDQPPQLTSISNIPKKRGGSVQRHRQTCYRKVDDWVDQSWSEQWGEKDRLSEDSNSLPGMGSLQHSSLSSEVGRSSNSIIRRYSRVLGGVLPTRPIHLPRQWKQSTWESEFSRRENNSSRNSGRCTLPGRVYSIWPYPNESITVTKHFSPSLCLSLSLLIPRDSSHQSALYLPFP